MTALKYDSAIKSHLTLIAILVFFERSYVVLYSCKVSKLGLNWLTIYGGGLFLHPLSSSYLILKKPRLVRVIIRSKTCTANEVFH